MTTFVKICGITNVQDALLAVALGADALGFVFAPSSRMVTQEAVLPILAQLPSGILTFGVFKSERPERVVEVVHSLGLRGAQLHGEMPPRVTEYISQRVQRTVRAFAAGREDLTKMSEYSTWANMIDSPTPGSGKVFDWSIVGTIPERHRLILAGGLDADNVGEAIRSLRPFGVDVSTGVEASPGRKDPRKLRDFIDAVRRVEGNVERDDDGSTRMPHIEEEPPFNWEVNT